MSRFISVSEAKAMQLKWHEGYDILSCVGGRTWIWRGNGWQIEANNFDGKDQTVMMKYSIDEIDQMRQMVGEIFAMETGRTMDQISPSYTEDMLRTHMLNGTTLHEMKRKLAHAKVVVGAKVLA